MNVEEDKRRVGTAAADEVRPGMSLGLGSGSTVLYFLQELGRRVAGGLVVRGIATSERTAALARELGIPLSTFGELPELDLDVDGADEVDPALNLVKGKGGALFREKIIARASRRRLIIVDSGKLSSALGSRARLPVEVLPFAAPLAERELGALGLMPELRKSQGEQPFVTDNGNWILDCGFGPTGRGAELEAAINDVTGVVENGLFVGLADEVLVAGSGRIDRLVRKRQTNS